MAIDEGVRRTVDLPEGGLDHAMVRGEGADRVGACRIACQQESLAATTAPVDLAPGAAPAGFSHPVGAAKAIEGVRAVPDVGQAALPYRRKIDARRCFRGMARTALPDGVMVRN